jgi:predicted anti-sigma-YlaC factor YlaD
MRCDQSRDLLSARLDGEATEDEVAVLGRHLASCPDCSDFAGSLEGVDRLTRLIPAEPVPDLTAAVMAAAAPAPAPHHHRREAARWSLAIVAITELLLALPSLLTDSSGRSVHTTRELGSWSAALAVGFLVAAWQPARARGMLPLGVVLAGVLTLGALFDILAGTAGGAGESAHLLEVAGVALLWLLAKRDEEATAAHPVLAR